MLHARVRKIFLQQYLPQAVNAPFRPIAWLMARLADLGGIALGGSPADFGKFVADETEKWAKVIKFAGIKAD